MEHLWQENSCDRPRLLGIEVSERSARLELRYEWYRRRDFAAGTEGAKQWSAVLVLWLDDAYFEDEPLLRLPLLLEGSVDAPRPANTLPPEVKLIGPRRSSTLRHMMPLWSSTAGRLSKLPDKNLENLAGRVLGQVDIFCATPSAMDEVLLKDPENSDHLPRQGFASFHNFAATDAQFAGEVFDELDLRGIHLIEKADHVVLISEWDTFYGRMLSLTYRAELAVRQHLAPSRAAFVDGVTSRRDPPAILPKNFHSFVYLRGLDGQTVGGEGGAKGASHESSKSEKSMPSSIEELRHWSPDINKAEGQAQFDYLGRLGDQVEELQQSLRQEQAGQIKAVGIVGSDVYDTLLILQALRPRFPNAVFFTTDLDVRFFHPREREWARNLVVVSSMDWRCILICRGPSPISVNLIGNFLISGPQKTGLLGRGDALQGLESLMLTHMGRPPFSR